jgi:predicted ATP-grasp superfamily ATP-dependent carboligase
MMNDIIDNNTLCYNGNLFCRNKNMSEDSQLAKNVIADVLVLDACERQALATVRSLGRRGLRVATLGSDKSAPAFASRWCLQKLVCPAEVGSEAYLAFLEQALEYSGVHVIIPCSDATISLLRLHRQRLEQRVRIALAKETALEIAVNKERTLEVARQLGLYVPHGVTVRDRKQIDKALQEVGLPAVVKPVESWVAYAQQGIRLTSFLVATRAEAYHAVETLLTYSGSSVLIQQFLPGERESMSFLYAQGRFFAKFAHAIERTDPPLGGADVVRHSIPIPLDIGKPAEALVREINLEGYCIVEFRRDRTGRPYLMEVNPRLSAGVELAIASGIDFPYLLYQWACGEQIDTVTQYRVNCHMRYLAGDIATTAVSIKLAGRPGITPPLRAILAFCFTFFLPMHYDYVDWHDLQPVKQAVIGWFRVLPGRIRRAFARKG